MIPDGLLQAHVAFHLNTLIRETVPDHIALAAAREYQEQQLVRDYFHEPY